MSETQYIWYGWKDMMLDVNALIRQLVLSKFIPEVVVGIARGGLTPAVMISHWLNLPFKPIHASLRDFPHWEDYLPKKSDKRILIVDDICDSGETFARLQNHIDGRGKANKIDIRFATLWWNNECDFEPNYWIRDCAKDSGNIWIHFPWEAWWSSQLRNPDENE